MSQARPKVLVTAALTYANGSIHLGHLLEAIQTDVYVRARKLAGDDVIFMWAADTHGTPIQLRARAEGIDPEQLVARVHGEHLVDYRDFDIGSDIYYTTHSPEDQRHCEAIFQAMRARGDIVTREVEQFYSVEDDMFLADRFIKGTCPKCKAEDQYGDNCEVCGATYTPTDLIDPRSAISGARPELRRSTHLFVPLARHEGFLREWLRAPEDGGRTRLQPAIRNYVMSWVDEGLRDWDISRERPYFGWEIPGFPQKYFYVWFDAPIGYIAATERFCADTGRDFESYWKDPQSDAEIVHVIGKDIVYFHTLFWPAMLHAAGYRTPSRVQVHGWLTVNGAKMSKARGTFVLARTYLDHLDPAYLRYYLAAKLGGGQDDLDLDLNDFRLRVNADLVKKAANLASRCIKFIVGRLGGRVGAPDPGARDLLDRAAARAREAAGLYAEFESSRALRLAIEIAEEANLYLTESAPWKLAKSDPERARSICAVGVMATQIIAAIFKPVLPRWAEKVERMLGLTAPLDFASAADPLPADRQLTPYETLAEPVQEAALAAIVEASKQTVGGAEAAETGEGEAADPLAPEVTIDAFTPIDLRVGEVVACEAVGGADTLLRLTVDLGPLGRRTILSGLAGCYEPAALVGKKVAVLANLKPRKMRFGVSEGMVLAAGSGEVFTVVELDARARPGDRIT